MADHPILFSSPMILANLREIEQPGTGKTQTRRLMPYQDRLRQAYSPFVSGTRILNYACEEEISRAPISKGDRLWVREAWCTHAHYDDLKPSLMGGEEPIQYQADGAHQTWGYPAISKIGRPRPGMFMPRWASRLTLYVTEVRVERLQDISRDDAMAEGIVQTWGDFMGDPPEWAVASINRHGDASGSHIYDNRTSVENYRELWNHINGPGAWAQNPWVAVTTYVPRLGNLDALPATIAEAA